MQGKVHDKITIITAPIIMLAGINIGFSESMLMSISYLFAGLLFNGDLDTYSRPYKRWWIFRFYWIPYQMLIPHRNILSHGPIIGTLIRLLYISPILLLIPHSYFQYEWWWIIIGLELGALSHIICDGFRV